MLKTILSISGKPGLFKLISQAKNMLIVESLQTGKRQPAYAHEKIISLGDIAIFTDEEDVPLSEVLNAIKEKENGAKVTLDIKKADNETLRAYLCVDRVGNNIQGFAHQLFFHAVATVNVLHDQ